MIIFNNFVKGKFLSVYDDTESDGKFHICRYLCDDNRYVLFQAISTRGYCDGFYCIPMSSVFRIDMDDEYTKRIQRLFRLQGQKELNFYMLDNRDLLSELISYAKEEKLISSLFLDDGENVTGKIKHIDCKKEIITVERLSDDGKNDGTALISVNSIEKVICNSGWERCIEMLIN